MKSALPHQLEKVAPDQRLGFFREHLQKSALRALHEAEMLSPEGVSFMGGTCLRMAHGSGRFSEDLDFSLNQPSDIFNFTDIVRQSFSFPEARITRYSVEVAT